MDIMSSEQRSKVMKTVRNKNTKPELRVRSLLHRMGFRFRLHRKDMPGCPDIVLPRYKKIILVNGCFWHGHGHERCSRNLRNPQNNADFWRKKLEGNKRRDAINLMRLRISGWKVLVVWECELKDMKAVGRKIEGFMN